MIRELHEYRHLLIMLTWKEIRIRYKQTVMGFFWALLMPMLIVAAGVLIRQAYAMYSGEAVNMKVVASLCVKSLPWSFFVGAIRFSTNSLTGNSNLVTKIYFPREVFPISAVLAHLFDFCIASIPVIIIVALSGTGVSIHLLWLPLLLVLLILLTMGLGFFLSCGNLFFRDVKYIVDVFLTFGIFFTPVFYEAKMLGKWAPAVLLNPLAPILEAMNHVIILHQPPDYAWLTYSGCWAIFGFLLSWLLFERAEYAFAENI
jgi:ABC-type polysaccharide/polyol phosphate export permease